MNKEDSSTYKVLVNAEEQYCIWFDYLAAPAGWRPVGISGPMQDCLNYVKMAWTDMRPLSHRRKTDGVAAPA